MSGLLIAILWVLCAGVAALIAQAKGRSVGGFAMAGLLLGAIGVVWAACAESGSDRQRAAQLRRHGSRRPDLSKVPPLTWRDSS